MSADNYVLVRPNPLISGQWVVSIESAATEAQPIDDGMSRFYDKLEAVEYAQELCGEERVEYGIQIDSPQSSVENALAIQFSSIHRRIADIDGFICSFGGVGGGRVGATPSGIDAQVMHLIEVALTLTRISERMIAEEQAASTAEES